MSFHCLTYSFSLRFSTLIMMCLGAFLLLSSPSPSFLLLLLCLFKSCLRFANLEPKGSFMSFEKILDSIYPVPFSLSSFSGTLITCIIVLMVSYVLFNFLFYFLIYVLIWLFLMHPFLTSQILSSPMSVHC